MRIISIHAENRWALTAALMCVDFSGTHFERRPERQQQQLSGNKWFAE